MFYMDTSLTIGRRSSPGIFNSLPDAVECKIKKSVWRHTLELFIRWFLISKVSIWKG